MVATRDERIAGEVERFCRVCKRWRDGRGVYDPEHYRFLVAARADAEARPNLRQQWDALYRAFGRTSSHRGA